MEVHQPTHQSAFNLSHPTMKNIDLDQYFTYKQVSHMNHNQFQEFQRYFAPVGLGI